MVIVDRSYDSCNCIAAYAGSYNGQQRPLTSKKDAKYSFHICLDFFSSENTNNLVRKTKSEPGVLLEFLQGAQEDNMVGKVNP